MIYAKSVDRDETASSIHRFRRRCRLSKLLTDRLKFFFPSIFSSGGHFIQRSGTIWAILIAGHPRNILKKLF